MLEIRHWITCKRLKIDGSEAYENVNGKNKIVEVIKEFHPK